MNGKQQDIFDKAIIIFFLIFIFALGCGAGFYARHIVGVRFIEQKLHEKIWSLQTNPNDDGS